MYTSRCTINKLISIDNNEEEERDFFCIDYHSFRVFDLNNHYNSIIFYYNYRVSNIIDDPFFFFPQDRKEEKDKMNE